MITFNIQFLLFVWYFKSLESNEYEAGQFEHENKTFSVLLEIMLDEHSQAVKAEINK